MQCVSSSNLLFGMVGEEFWGVGWGNPRVPHFCYLFSGNCLFSVIFVAFPYSDKTPLSLFLSFEQKQF